VTATSAGLRPPVSPKRAGFRSVLWAEWVKFRTVRGWIAGLAIAVLACVLFSYLVANGTHSGTCTGAGTNCKSGHPFVPTGPGGQAVADSYQYLARPLTGNGTITVQVASLTGLISSSPVNVAPSLSATRPSLAGWAKVTAFTAIAVLALGAMLRRSAGAVTAGIVVFVLPYVIGSSLSGGTETWLFRLTPAAAFSVLGVLPRSALVDYPYTFGNGYYPLPPWAGLLVLAAYTVTALAAARVLLARRDA
jgi:hypothetical protein